MSSVTNHSRTSVLVSLLICDVTTAVAIYTFFQPSKSLTSTAQNSPTDTMSQCIHLAHAIACQTGGGTSSNSSTYQSHSLFSTSSHSLSLCPTCFSLCLFFLSPHLPAHCHHTPTSLWPLPVFLCPQRAERWLPSTYLVFGTHCSKLL